MIVLFSKSVLLLAMIAVPCLGRETERQLTPIEGTTPCQWRVVWHADPAHQATVSWSTAEKGTKHQVWLSKDSPDGQERAKAFSVAAHRNGRFTPGDKQDEGVPLAWYHHAKLNGLEPSTTYRIVLDSDGERSEEFYFVTAPVEDVPFKILYGGDSRSGHEARQQMNRLMAEVIEEEPTTLAFAHGGDYIYNGRSWRDWRAWLSHQELCTGKDGRLLPILPVRGNHDSGPLYDEIFDDHGGVGRNYSSLQIGPEVAIITLNSNISTTGDQALWLEEELDRLRPENRWLLAQFHRPLYPAVKSPGPAKSTWVPLFEGFDLDLVLESDGHVMKRTMPIREEKFDPTGVTYIGEGGLGVPQREPDAERWYLKEPGVTGAGHHVTLLSFEPDSLRMLTLGLPKSEREFIPEGYAEIIEPHSVWSFHTGNDPTGEWMSQAFDDSKWEEGEAGFGYGDDDDTTVLHDMRGAYSRVYIRTLVPAERLVGVETLALRIRYDDAFIAYAGGVEFARSGIASGAGGAATTIQSHEARSTYEFFSIPNWADRMEEDGLQISIEGHNGGLTSSDFTLDPYIIADPENDSARGVTGKRWIMDDHSLTPREK